MTPRALQAFRNTPKIQVRWSRHSRAAVKPFNSRGIHPALQKHSRHRDQIRPHPLHCNRPAARGCLYVHSELEQSPTKIANLKIALNFGNKLLGTTYRREWKLWQWIDDLSIAQREERRLKGHGKFFGKRSSSEGDRELDDARLPEGSEWENFGHGPDPLGAGKGGGIHTEQSSSEVGEAAGTASLQKDELGNILSMAEKNMRMLKEGVAEMVALVQACKLRATGIQEPQEWEM